MSKTSTPMSSVGLLGSDRRANKAPKVVCFGEVLWDLLPSGPRPGGAPANVAFHAARLGARTALISRVGNDELGLRARQALGRAGVDVSSIQIDPERETGRVLVDMSDPEPRYEICSGAAWDGIDIGPEQDALIGDADFFCLGTLASRTPEQARRLLGALERLPPAAERGRPTVALDLNLRPPFIDRSLVLALLAHADVLKLSAGESRWLSEQLGFSPVRLVEEGRLVHLVTTDGPDEAELCTRGERVTRTPPPVRVGDVVGAGDAFFAALCVSLARGLDAGPALEVATREGAWVASQIGGMPGLVF